eukprot:219521-Rhodomonas_salina.1
MRVEHTRRGSSAANSLQLPVLLARRRVRCMPCACLHAHSSPSACRTASALYPPPPPRAARSKKRRREREKPRGE